MKCYSLCMSGSLIRLSFSFKTLNLLVLEDWLLALIQLILLLSLTLSICILSNLLKERLILSLKEGFLWTMPMQQKKGGGFGLCNLLPDEHVDLGHTVFHWVLFYELWLNLSWAAGQWPCSICHVVSLKICKSKQRWLYCGHLSLQITLTKATWWRFFSTMQISLWFFKRRTNTSMGEANIRLKNQSDWHSAYHFPSCRWRLSLSH